MGHNGSWCGRSEVGMGQHDMKTEGWQHNNQYHVVVGSVIVNAMLSSCEQESGQHLQNRLGEGGLEAPSLLADFQNGLTLVLNISVFEPN